MLSGTVHVCALDCHRTCPNVSRREGIAAALIHRRLDIQGWVRLEKSNRLENNTKVFGWHPKTQISMCLFYLKSQSNLHRPILRTGNVAHSYAAKSGTSVSLVGCIVYRCSPTVRNSRISLFSTLSPVSAHSTTESFG